MEGGVCIEGPSCTLVSDCEFDYEWSYSTACAGTLDITLAGQNDGFWQIPIAEGGHGSGSGHFLVECGEDQLASMSLNGKAATTFGWCDACPAQ